MLLTQIKMPPVGKRDRGTKGAAGDQGGNLVIECFLSPHARVRQRIAMRGKERFCYANPP